MHIVYIGDIKDTVNLYGYNYLKVNSSVFVTCSAWLRADLFLQHDKRVEM